MDTQYYTILGFMRDNLFTDEKTMVIITSSLMYNPLERHDIIKILKPFSEHLTRQQCRLNNGSRIFVKDYRSPIRGYHANFIVVINPASIPGEYHHHNIWPLKGEPWFEEMIEVEFER